MVSAVVIHELVRDRGRTVVDDHLSGAHGRWIGCCEEAVVEEHVGVEGHDGCVVGCVAGLGAADVVVRVVVGVVVDGAAEESCRWGCGC